MNLRKIIFLSPIAIILAFFVITTGPGAKSQVQQYYDGEAISYDNQLIFGTANSGRFELFKLAGSQIKLMGAIYSDDSENSRFLDVVFSKENNHLFAYLVNGKYLYKYDITDLSDFYLIKKVKDNSYDYFYGLGNAGDKIYTVGKKGLKVWNNDMQIVDSYNKFDVKFPKSAGFSKNGNYFFNTNGGYLRVIDSFYRDKIFETKLNIVSQHSIHPSVDDKAGIVYIVDDYSLKKVKIDGSYSEFKHISNVGYDVDGIDGSNYLYFSDGIGVVKTRKSDLKPVDWVYTTSLGAKDGWSMGLRAVKNNGQEFVVVFNGTNILVFNDRLDLFGLYQSQEKKYFEPEKLYLNLDRNRAAANSSISINGGGFGANEDLKIIFGNDVFYAQTDKYGQFRKIIYVPDVKRGNTDIKVDAQVSKLTYSINFFIE